MLDGEQEKEEEEAIPLLTRHINMISAGLPTCCLADFALRRPDDFRKWCTKGHFSELFKSVSPVVVALIIKPLMMLLVHSLRT